MIIVYACYYVYVLCTLVYDVIPCVMTSSVCVKFTGDIAADLYHTIYGCYSWNLDIIGLNCIMHLSVYNIQLASDHDITVDMEVHVAPVRSIVFELAAVMDTEYLITNS